MAIKKHSPLFSEKTVLKVYKYNTKKELPFPMYISDIEVCLFHFCGSINSTHNVTIVF